MPGVRYKSFRYELSQYPFADPKIRELECEVLEIIRYQNDARDTLRASIWFDMPRTPNTISDPVLDAVINVLETFALRLAQIQLELTELYERKNTIERFMKQIDPTEKRAVELIFFENMRVTSVARSLHMSIPGIYSLLTRVLKNEEGESEDSLKPLLR